MWQLSLGATSVRLANSEFCLDAGRSMSLSKYCDCYIDEFGPSSAPGYPNENLAMFRKPSSSRMVPDLGWSYRFGRPRYVLIRNDPSLLLYVNLLLRSLPWLNQWKSHKHECCPDVYVYRWKFEPSLALWLKCEIEGWKLHRVGRWLRVAIVDWNWPTWSLFWVCGPYTTSLMVRLRWFWTILLQVMIY